MTTEERKKRMEAAGYSPSFIQSRLKAAKNKTNEEALDMESMQKLTDKEIKIQLLKESIKQTEYSESTNLIARGYAFLTVFMILIALITWIAAAS